MSTAGNPKELAAALAGDQYGWLALRLPEHAPVPCPRCSTPMRFRTVRLVFACPTCEPHEVTP